MNKIKNIKSVKIRDYKIEDDYVLIKKDGSLPRKCVITNEPTTAKDKIKFQFRQNIEFFDGKTSKTVRIIGLSLIAAGLNRNSLNKNEKIEFSYYLCKKLRNKQNLIRWSLISVIITLFYFVFNFLSAEKNNWLALIPLFLIVLVLHFIDVYRHPIKNLGYNKGFYFLAGCGEAFNKGLKEELSEN